MSSEWTGFVSLVGAGPGSADLLTLAGLDRLRRADAILHDRLVGDRLLRLAPATAERVDVGKRCGQPHASGPAQEAIITELIARARRGQRVVRLKGGDPLLFARGGEEALALTEAGVPFEIIPGVTAALAASAFAGIPLTDRALASGTLFLTGHEDPAKEGSIDWAHAARFRGTLAIYMPLARIAAIAESLLAGGRSADEPAALIERAGDPDQRVVETTLGELAGGKAPPLESPALALIGPVVHRRRAINWFDARPLSGQIVLMTRPVAPELDSEESADLGRPRWREFGAEVVVAPSMELIDPEPREAVDARIEAGPRAAWVVFTSGFGVDFLMRRLHRQGRDARWFAGSVRLAAIGPATAAALARHGLRADLVPRSARGEGLAEELLAESAPGDVFLLPRADRGRATLPDTLRAMGRHVEEWIVYRQRDVVEPPEAVRAAFAAGKPIWLPLTSGNAARVTLGWVQASARAPAAVVRIASISPVTSAVIRELGFEPEVEAARPDETALLEAIVRVSRSGGETSSGHQPPRRADQGS